MFGELPDCCFADAVGGVDEGAVRLGGRVEGMRGKEEREGMVGRWRREREGGLVWTVLLKLFILAGYIRLVFAFS